MRRVLVALALSMPLAALWASASFGGTPASKCPTRPAATYSTRAAPILELLVHDAVLDSFTDAAGRALTPVGNGLYLDTFPGRDENSFVNRSWGTDILFDRGYPNAYAAGLHTNGKFPVEIRIRRYDAAVRLDGIATWVLFTPRTSNITLAYATGEPLASLRLCLDRKRDGTIDASLPPTGVVQGAAARDGRPPRISGRVLAQGNGKATLAIRAVDPGGHAASGLAGIWWGGALVGYGGRYTKPVRVPLAAKLVVVASDRAGNLASTSLDVAALASASR